MAIEPFNPARHGGVLESYRQISRSGTNFTFMSFLFFIFAVGFAIVYFQLYVFSTAVFLLGLIASAGIGFIFITIGFVNSSRALDFNSRLRRLTTVGGGSMVTRGAIQHVRSSYIFLGRTNFTAQGESMAMDTSWVFHVTYAFEDDKGKLRRKIALIPDLIGPKRQHIQGNQTFMDSRMPRIGMMVDVAFDDYHSIVLRLIPAT